MNANRIPKNKSYRGLARLTACALGIVLCFGAGETFARDLGRGVGGAGPGVRPGYGVGGVRAGGARGVGVVPGIGVGAPGRGVLPGGFHYAVPGAYVTAVRAGYTCRLAAGVYYRAVTYQGQTVWVVVP